MRAELQTTKTYHVALDETEKLELCAEISLVEEAGCESHALYNLRTVLTALECHT